MTKMSKSNNYFRVVFIILMITILILIFADLKKNHCKLFAKFYDKSTDKSISKTVPKFEKDLLFMDSNNITGYPYLIVPNIVHYVLFGINQIEFAHYVSILSVLKNQNPDIIFIHCDCDQLYGQYYQKVIEKVKQSKTVFEIRRTEKPTEIFGIPLSKEYLNWHSSDITRLRVLSEFGGIYLDRDVYVVKSLDVFRKFEMTINWDLEQFLGNQVIIAHRNARFLHQYLDSYHSYDESQWYYNAGELPTKSILYKHPEYVHRLTGEFGTDGPHVCPKIYSIYFENWRQEFYAIHLLIRGDEIALKDWCFGRNNPKIMKFNESIALGLTVTFGEMYRDLFVK